MMEGPRVVAPPVWIFAPDVFPQLPQIIAIEFFIHHLSWWNKFLVHYAFYVKKTNQHSLGITPNILCFFGRDEVGVFHRDNCCVVSGSCPNTQDVTSNDGDKDGVVFGLFLELSADSNAVFLFIIAPQH
jgi:hypothetical protein